MALDRDAVSVSDRRPDADIGHRDVALAALKVDLRGIYAVARYDDALGKMHVYRRCAELPADVVAGMNSVRQRMRVAEIARRFLHVPVRNELADICGADDASVKHDRRHNVAAYPALLAIDLELFGLAFALIAKAEVVSDDDPADVELVYDRIDELLPRHAHHVFVEMDEHNVIYSIAAPDDLLPADWAVDKRDLCIEHEVVRMHVKAQHRRHRADLNSALLCLFQQ